MQMELVFCKGKGAFWKNVISGKCGEKGVAILLNER